ncbi:NC domain-containing protein-like protein [Actinidia rufa]|uniref:NC domain-containing protein-like protein n=1 Tax=Actinidia rufa TaxID=165716 RepID=A0A7J0GDP9_9ERIC|nr:NC domain-containing protein-like protein [Actinidia rufa]
MWWHLNSSGFRLQQYCGPPDKLPARQWARSGQAASIIGGRLAAVLSTPLRLVTTNIYGMAATAVVVYCASQYAVDIGMRRDVMKVSVEDLTRRLETGALQVVEPSLPALAPPANASTYVEAFSDEHQPQGIPVQKYHSSNRLSHFAHSTPTTLSVATNVLNPSSQLSNSPLVYSPPPMPYSQSYNSTSMHANLGALSRYPQRMSTPLPAKGRSSLTWRLTTPSRQVPLAHRHEPGSIHDRLDIRIISPKGSEILVHHLQTSIFGTAILSHPPVISSILTPVQPTSSQCELSALDVSKTAHPTKLLTSIIHTTYQKEIHSMIPCKLVEAPFLTAKLVLYEQITMKPSTLSIELIAFSQKSERT